MLRKVNSGHEHKLAQPTRAETQMNEDQYEGKWDQIRGRAKRVWGELTDDDFKRADGSVDKLHGLIQERFGDTKEAIIAKLAKLHL
jgi:uncharacterized protein YjbJ (UPF0337 family)